LGTVVEIQAAKAGGSENRGLSRFFLKGFRFCEGKVYWTIIPTSTVQGLAALGWELHPWLFFLGIRSHLFHKILSKEALKCFFSSTRHPPSSAGAFQETPPLVLCWQH
jgi:hypothetical protein